MGLYSVVEESWACPFCGERQAGEIQIKFGLRDGIYRYKIGDKIHWSESGYNHDEGPPNRVVNGTGEIRGLVGCKNSWRTKFPGYDPENPEHYRFDPRTPELIRQYGCPDMMNAFIEVEDLIIRRVFFSSNLEKTFEDV